MNKDRDILRALMELDKLKYELLNEKECLEEALLYEYKELGKDIAKSCGNFGVLLTKATTLCLGVVFALAFINTLGIPTPYIHLVKALPLGVQNYFLIFHKHKYPFKMNHSKKNKLSYKEALDAINICLEEVNDSYNKLFSELSLETMQDIVKGFEYKEENTNNKAKTLDRI